MERGSKTVARKGFWIRKQKGLGLKEGAGVKAGGVCVVSRASCRQVWFSPLDLLYNDEWGLVVHIKFA